MEDVTENNGGCVLRVCHNHDGGIDIELGPMAGFEVCAWGLVGNESFRREWGIEGALYLRARRRRRAREMGN